MRLRHLLCVPVNQAVVASACQRCPVRCGPPQLPLLNPHCPYHPCRPPLQGLFERHKLLVATQLCMRILKKKGDLSQEKFDYLLRGRRWGRGRA